MMISDGRGIQALSIPMRITIPRYPEDEIMSMMNLARISIIQAIISSLPEDPENYHRSQDQPVACKQIQGVNSQVAHEKSDGQVSYDRRGEKADGDQKPVIRSRRE